MAPELLKDLNALMRRTSPISLVTPYHPPVEYVASASGEMTSTTGALSPLTPNGQPIWGWGQSSGFWAGRTGAAATRGTAGGALPGVVGGNSMPAHLDHCCVIEVKRHHVDMVRRLVHALDARCVIVFMNSQTRLKDALHKLAARGINAGILHGEMQKQRRQAVVQAFAAGQLQVLLVSDVASRGLDVQNCDAVINLELPSNAGHYAHRAGRTGRMGRPGVVCSIVESQHEFVIDKMRRALAVDVAVCKVSGGRATIIRDGKVKVLGRFNETVAESEAEVTVSESLVGVQADPQPLR
jgi:hypothetical protein